MEECVDYGINLDEEQLEFFVKCDCGKDTHSFIKFEKLAELKEKIKEGYLEKITGD